MTIIITGNLYILIPSPFSPIPQTPPSIQHPSECFLYMMSLFLSCLFLYFFDSTYKWNRRVFVSLTDLCHLGFYPLGPIYVVTNTFKVLFFMTQKYSVRMVFEGITGYYSFSVFQTTVFVAANSSSISSCCLCYWLPVYSSMI